MYKNMRTKQKTLFIKAAFTGNVPEPDQLLTFSSQISTTIFYDEYSEIVKIKKLNTSNKK